MAPCTCRSYASPCTLPMERMSTLDVEAAERDAYDTQKPRHRAAILAGALLLLASAIGITVNAPSPKDGGGAEQAQRRARGLRCGGPLDVGSPLLAAGGEAAAGGTCREYRLVCVDQEHVISFDPAYSPSNVSAAPIPRLDISGLHYSWAAPRDWRGTPAASSASSSTGRLQYQPLSFRPAGALEASPDLQQPRFDTCSVPVVVWTSWPHSPEAVLAQLAARLWQLQTSGAMSNASLLVLGTPPGERLPPFVYHLLEPLTPNPLFSFGELSARTPHTPGRPGRCFDRAYLCAFSGTGPLAGLYAAMQWAAAFDRARRPRQSESSAPFDGGAGVLKVLIQHSSGAAGSASLANHEELVVACNRHTGWQLDPASPVKRVQCRGAGFAPEDPLLDLRSVHSADVLVTPLGHGCMRWLAMRSGSALLELRTFQAGPREGPGLYSNVSLAIESELRWYGLDVQDPLASPPSQQRQQQSGSSGSIVDDLGSRSSHGSIALPVPALLEMLQRVASAAGSKERYKQQAEQGLQHAELLPGGKLQPVR